MKKNKLVKLGMAGLMLLIIIDGCNPVQTQKEEVIETEKKVEINSTEITSKEIFSEFLVDELKISPYEIKFNEDYSFEEGEEFLLLIRTKEKLNEKTLEKFVGIVKEKGKNYSKNVGDLSEIILFYEGGKVSMQLGADGLWHVRDKMGNNIIKNDFKKRPHK